MPLVWAHAEHIKLLRFLSEGRVFEMPPQPVQRYQIAKTGSPHSIWRFNHTCRVMPRERILRIEALAPMLVHWSADGWRAIEDVPSRDTGLGVHVVDLPTAALAPMLVHWSADGWRAIEDVPSDTGLGVHVVDLPTAALPAGSQLLFTFLWLPDRWEGEMSKCAPAYPELSSWVADQSVQTHESSSVDRRRRRRSTWRNVASM